MNTPRDSFDRSSTAQRRTSAKWRRQSAKPFEIRAIRRCSALRVTHGVAHAWRTSCDDALARPKQVVVRIAASRVRGARLCMRAIAVCVSTDRSLECPVVSSTGTVAVQADVVVWHVRLDAFPSTIGRPVVHSAGAAAHFAGLAARFDTFTVRSNAMKT